MTETARVSRYWRGRYWGEQARIAFGVVVVAGIVLAFLVPDHRFILIAAALVAVPVWLAVKSWLALDASDADGLPAGFWRQRLIGVIAVVGAFSISFFSRGIEWETALLPVAVLIGAMAWALYAWRDALGRPVGWLTATFERVSVEGAFVHLAGYMLALAAALAASTCFDGFAARSAAYIGAGLTAKLVADFVFATSAPLGDRTLAAALARMTVLSPLWWGLPWGVLIAGCLVATQDQPQWEIMALITSNLPVIWHVMIATVLVFAAVTTVAMIRETRIDRAWAAGQPDDERTLRPSDWAMLHWGVIALALTAYTVVFVPFWRSDAEEFGVETWTCAKEDGRWTLGWIAEAGINIKVHGYVRLFNISCVPGADGRCDYDEEGWDEIVTTVHGKDGYRTTVAINRASKDVVADLMHHAGVYGQLGNEFVWALYNGNWAELSIKAPRGRLLYTKRMDLRGYARAFNACRARWQEE